MTWTPERHAEARKRCEVATAGPWARGGWGGQCHMPEHVAKGHPGGGKCKYDTYFAESDDHHELVSRSVENSLVAGNYEYDAGGIVGEADSDFIAAARTDLPDALDEIERLRTGIREFALEAERRGMSALAGSLLVWLDTPGGKITFGPEA